MSVQNTSLLDYGWFDSAARNEPAYDPGLSVACPVCAQPLRTEALVTISLMAMTRRDRSYFFRAHRACWRGLTERARQEIEGWVIDGEAGGIQ